MAATYSLPRPYLRLNGESEGDWVDIDTHVEGDQMTLIVIHKDNEVARLSIDAFKFALIWGELRSKQRKEQDAQKAGRDD